MGVLPQYWLLVVNLSLKHFWMVGKIFGAKLPIFCDDGACIKILFNFSKNCSLEQYESLKTSFFSKTGSEYPS